MNGWTLRRDETGQATAMEWSAVQHSMDCANDAARKATWAERREARRQRALQRSAEVHEAARRQGRLFP